MRRDPLSGHQTLITILAAVLSLTSACNHDSVRQHGPLSRRGGQPLPLAQKFKPNQPFAFIIPQQAPVAGVDGVSAKDCGVCHTRHYAEWQQATHAHALSDLQYQAELHKPSSPRWLCLNCHIPVQNQRRHVVEGLYGGDVLRPAVRKNPGFDRAMQQEAITCATCHVRRDGNGPSYVVGPRGSRTTPHPTKRDPQFLRKTCMRCHDPRGRRITPVLACWFKTREELEKGPYGGAQSCVGCHMPATKRRLAPLFKAYPARGSHQHHWVGGGVPKWYRGYDQLLARGYRSGLDVKIQSATVDNASGSLALAVKLTNARAGHWLPTADPERHLLVQASLHNAQRRRLHRSTYRIGQKWRWSPRAEKVADNRLKPTESRVWRAKLKLGASQQAIQLVVTVYHVRLTTQNARHMKRAKVSDVLVQGTTKLVPNIERHYPMASVLFRATIDLATGKRRFASPAELIALSKKEQAKPLGTRDY